MSDQKNESNSTATLEEVFLSRQFERSQRGAGHGPEEGIAIANARHATFTGTFDSALSRGSDDAAGDGGLEDVLLTARLGTMLTLVPPLRPAGATPAAERVVVPSPPWPQRDNRYRAIAAVSGIAAAALVVAGVSTGTGQPRSGDVAALGQRPTAQPLGGLSSLGGAPTGSPAPGAGTPNAALSSAYGSGAAVSFQSTGTSQPTNAPSSARAVSGSAGTTFTAEPLPGGPSGSGGGTGVGTGSPAPSPPVGADPVVPGTTALGSSVAGVGTSVTSAAGQLGSSMPAAATVAAAVGGGGATVSQLGQTVGSTTA